MEWQYQISDPDDAYAHLGQDAELSPQLCTLHRELTEGWRRDRDKRGTSVPLDNPLERSILVDMERERRRLVGITVAISWPIILRLREIADERETTLPALVREAVNEWLERQERGGEQ